MNDFKNRYLARLLKYCDENKSFDLFIRSLISLEQTTISSDPMFQLCI